MQHRLLPLALLLTAPSLVSLRATETLAVVPDSAQAIGMVGGRFANLDDASALRHSPANLAASTEAQFQINTGFWYGDITLAKPDGESISMQDHWKYLGSMYYAQPVIPGKLTLGIGVGTPYGIAGQFTKDHSARYSIPYQTELVAVSITPMAALQVTDRVAIAAGLDVMYSSLAFRQVFPWSAALGAATPDGEVQFEGNGWGVGGYAGLSIDLTDRQRISLVGRLPISIDYSGDFNAQGLPAGLQAAGFSQRSDFNSEMEFPASFGIGYGIDLTDRWTIGMDFQWSENSSHDDIPLDVGGNQALLGRDAVELGWKNSIDLGLGMQYRLNDQWTLRAGYLFSENSQPNSTYTLSIPNGDRHLFATGIGYRIGRHGIDLAYSYSYYGDREVNTNNDPALNGRYQIGWHVMTASYSYRF